MNTEDCWAWLLLDILEGIVVSCQPDPVEEVETRQSSGRMVPGCWMDLIQVMNSRNCLTWTNYPRKQGLVPDPGGFIFSHLETIPVAGQHFEWNGLRFEIMDMMVGQIRCWFPGHRLMKITRKQKNHDSSLPAHIGFSFRRNRWKLTFPILTWLASRVLDGQGSPPLLDAITWHCLAKHVERMK